MQDVIDAFAAAAGLILGFDDRLAQIVLLSLRVTLTAVGIAMVIGLPLGIWLARNPIQRNAGRVLLIAVAGFGLVAASFGIINTLLMAVQERTREIGLMKALGMTGGKIFGLFTMEAVVIGLLGSLIGIGLGVAVGLIANQVLTTGPLSGVTGLVLFAVKPHWTIILLIVTALSAAMFTNIKFIHPVRTERWRGISLPVSVLWCVFAARAAWVDFHPDSWANWGLVVTSLWLLLAGPAQQLMPKRT